MIIAFIGMPGAGKSLAIETLKEEGIPVIHLRPVVEEECKRRGLPVNNRTLREVATDLRKKHGRDVVVQRAILKIDAAYKQGSVAVDSLKSPEEVNFLRKRGYDVALIAVHASPLTRFERIKERGEKWDPKELDEFNWRDQVELKWGLGNLIAQADTMLVNEFSPDSLVSTVRQLLSTIRRGESSESVGSPGPSAGLYPGKRV
jgi:dephospho-CoA kinase